MEDARRVQSDVDRTRVAPCEAFAEVDAAVLPEARDRLPSAGVESIEPVPRAEVDAPRIAALPVHQAADTRPGRLFASLFGSKLHLSAPVAASSPKTRSVGEVA